MSFKNAIIPLALFYLLVGWCMAPGVKAATLNLATSEREFVVTSFQIPGAASRPAVLVLSGAKGYKANAYSRLAAALNSSGIDVFLIHYISDADLAVMENAGSARVRIAYYAKRMPDWTAMVRVTIDALRQQPAYQSGIGVLGISLGAMPAMAASANSASIDAVAVVDGGLPASFKSRVRSMPPLLLIWGSDDQVFPLTTATKLRDFTRTLGGTAEVHVYREEGHAFFLESNNSNAAAARRDIVDFFSTRLMHP